MQSDLREKIARERFRRDNALRQLEDYSQAAAEGVVEKLRSASLGESIKGAIQTSPWTACFASLGAGALFGRMLPSPSNESIIPSQRVIVEVRTADGTVVSAPPPAAINPLDLAMRALTVYDAARQAMSGLTSETAKNNASDDTAARIQNGPPENPI